MNRLLDSIKHSFLRGPILNRWRENSLTYTAATVLCIFLESVPAFDRFFQRPFFRDGKWLLSKGFHNDWKAILYTAPKVAIGIIGGVFLLIFLASVFRKRKSSFLVTWQKPALLVVVSVALVPLVVSILKALTGIYSPVDLLPYGGNFPHQGFLEQLWLYSHAADGRSFPAGHASGGFALMALCYLPLRRAWRNVLFLAGFASGWLMGLYQMGRGEHFMSHTLTSMFIAFALMTCAAKALRLRQHNTI